MAVLDMERFFRSYILHDRPEIAEFVHPLLP